MNTDSSPLATAGNVEVQHDGSTGEYIIVADGVEHARAAFHADLAAVVEKIAGKAIAADLLAQVSKNMGPWT